jgi:hypothetical protein
MSVELRPALPRDSATISGSALCFVRRGRGAVRTEWRLITTTHNLLKLHRHALAAA